MKKFALFLVTILGIVLLSQCQKEYDNHVIQKSDYPVFYLDQGQSIESDFTGIVTDVNGTPVSNALVEIGQSKTTTDADGYFSLYNVVVHDKHAYLSVKRSGFFHGSRTIVPKEGINAVEIHLLSNNPVGSFTANQGGTVKPGNASVDFKQGIIDATGKYHTGTVNVALQYLDPESDDLESIMPGDLVAGSANGEKILKTMGMLAVELTDKNGKKLQLAPGSEATIHVPLSASMKADAPKEIPLWYFDEERGYWQEEGKAILDGDEYVGKVKHFSFWNCDIPIDYIWANGIIKDQDGMPAGNVSFIARSRTAGGRYVRSKPDGTLYGRLPANDKIVFEFFAGLRYAATNVYHTAEVGPYSSDVTLPDIVVDLPDRIKLSGTVVDCQGEPVKEGFVFMNRTPVGNIVDGKYEIGTRQGVPVQLSFSGSIIPDQTKMQYYHSGFTEDTQLDTHSHCLNIGGGNSGGGNNGGGSGGGSNNGTWDINHTAYNFFLDGVNQGFVNTKEHWILHNLSGNKLTVYGGASSQPEEIFRLEINGFNGKGDYVVQQNLAGKFWFGDKNDPQCTVARNLSVYIDQYASNAVNEYVNIAFSGDVDVWNEDLGRFEVKRIVGSIERILR